MYYTKDKMAVMQRKDGGMVWKLYSKEEQDVIQESNKKLEGLSYVSLYVNTFTLISA